MTSPNRLAACAAALSETKWQTAFPDNGHRIGDLVLHLACAYPVEIHVARISCGPIEFGRVREAKLRAMAAAPTKIENSVFWPTVWEAALCHFYTRGVLL